MLSISSSWLPLKAKKWTENQRGKITYIVLQYLVGTCSNKNFSSLFCQLDSGKFSAKNNHTVVKSLRLWFHLPKLLGSVKDWGARWGRKQDITMAPRELINYWEEQTTKHTQNSNLILSYAFKCHLYTDRSRICVSSHNLTSWALDLHF